MIVEMKAEIVYHPEGYRISHKCAICGEEMFPCNALKKYCSRDCRSVGVLSKKLGIKVNSKKELLVYYEQIDRKYNSKFDKKPILQFRKDGSFVRRLDSAYKANIHGDENGAFSDTSVARCARGERKTYRSYLWIYEEDYTPEVLEQRVKDIHKRWSGICKPVVQLNLAGEFVNRYESITQARDKFLLATEMSIINQIKKKKWCDTCVGYLWMYEEDYQQQIS